MRKDKIWIVTADELAEADRLLQDPDEWRSAIDMHPTRRDDGLFPYGEHFLQCSECALYAMGEMVEPHVHYIVIGNNGGMRCEPQSIIAD